MRFWDTSAIVPLIVTQPSSLAIDAEMDTDPELMVWWATEIECVSAIARLERDGSLEPRDVAAAGDSLTRLAATWQEIQPSIRIRQVASRLVRVHPFRAADALQLAAAIAAADGDPRALPLVTLDERLARAAEREGFRVVQPA